MRIYQTIAKTKYEYSILPSVFSDVPILYKDQGLPNKKLNLLMLIEVILLYTFLIFKPKKNIVVRHKL